MPSILEKEETDGHSLEELGGQYRGLKLYNNYVLSNMSTEQVFQVYSN